MDLELKQNVSSMQQILEHLEQNDGYFKPSISTYVNIAHYAAKLHAKSNRIELWEKGNLAGLLAFYRQNQSSEFFISNISLNQTYRGLGYSNVLMKAFVDSCLSTRAALPIKLKLEVFSINLRAIDFYKRHMFEPINENNGTLIMQKIIVK